jgi:hypothetical protein
VKPGQYFSKTDCPPVEQTRYDQELKKMQKRYRNLVGTYIFICYTCRPDIMYGNNILCRSMSNPSYKHFEAALYLLRYLAGTKDAGITYRRGANMKPLIFADSDDGADETRMSCACHIIILAGAALLWSSKFIKEYSLSTCEAEIRAIAAALPAIKSALYIKKLMIETINNNIISNIDVDSTVLNLSTSLVILEDNKAAIDWSLKTTNTQRMRHIEKSLYWIKSKTADNTIRMIFTESEYQLADIGTKPVYSTTFVPMIQRIMTYFG